MPVELIDARLPDFGVPASRPELAREVYQQRLDSLLRARRASGLDALVIYADREHAANLSWLTDFDPRFEEALLILNHGEVPTLLVGPENLGRARRARIDVEVRLYPPFGLMGQDRSQTPDLEEVLSSAGVHSGHRVGVLGWKYFGVDETPRPDTWFETPSFIIDTLRRIVGKDGKVVNANALLMDPSTGLRAVNEVDQLAQFEFGAVMASEAIKTLLDHLRPGVTEFQIVQAMGLGILPHSCHTMLSTGDRLSGLDSPSDKVIERGDPLTTAIGYLGGLSSRVGWVAEDASELPGDAADYVERLAKPYFACAVEWYETIGIGVTGGAIDALVRRHLADPFFNLILNPGHLIHLDEWMNTPIYRGSTEALRSGQAIQCDIIPAVGAPYYSANIEDGIALLDEHHRDELRDRHPNVWGRVQDRRAFMRDVLGINLKPEVMPLSNLASALPPFLLAPNRLLAIR